jgi:hypothetical protein
MKMQEAMDIINNPHPKGFIVNFDNCVNGKWSKDHFPDTDLGEPLIPTEEEAWALAAKFAQKRVGRSVWLYVTDDCFNAVPGARSRMIVNREARNDRS